MKLNKLNKVGLIGIGISLIILARNYYNIVIVSVLVVALILFTMMALSKRRNV